MNQIDYENLGSRMKELRIKMKLTQAEVAKALNVTPGYISNVENNRTAMSLRILIYYARLLNISLDSLIGRIDSEYRETAGILSSMQSTAPYDTASSRMQCSSTNLSVP